MDYRAAFWERRREGLGREYLLHLQEEFSRLLYLSESGKHSRPTGGFYRFLTKRFSTQVFYEIEGDEVIVEAVFDCREDPDEIAGELAKR